MIAKWLPLFLQASLFLSVLALGFQATLEDATYLFRRPGLLLRSVAAMYVVVPLFAALVAAAFRFTPIVELGIVLMAVSPIPPVLPSKQLKLGGRANYVIGLLVAISVLAIALVPLALTLLSAVFPADAYVSAGAVARIIFTSVLLPLGIGMAVRYLATAVAEQAAPVVAKVATFVLVLSIVPIVVSAWPRVVALVGNGSILAIAVVAGIALLAGHLLGGPDPDDRTSLAVACVSRHPAIALVIGKANFPGQDVTAAVLLYLFVGSLASLPYQAWAKKHHAAAADGSSAGPS